MGSCREHTGPSMCRRRWRTEAVVPRTRLEVSRFIAQKKLSARASTVAPWGALPLRLTAKGERVSEMCSSGFSCNRNDYMKILTNRAIFRLAASLDVMATCGPAQLCGSWSAQIFKRCRPFENRAIRGDLSAFVASSIDNWG